MTPQEQPQPQPLRGVSLGARACVAGTAATVVLVGVALFLVPAALRGYVLGGAAVALVVSGIGGVLLARAAVLPPGDPRNGPMFVQSLVLDFGLQCVALVVGMVVMRALAMKFAGIAAFGITFAAVALVVHVAGAVLINRALGLRARFRES
jgi:hypothetical protein